MSLFRLNLRYFFKLTIIGITAISIFVLPTLRAQPFPCKTHLLTWLIETEPWQINHDLLISAETITPIPLLKPTTDISAPYCN